MLLETDCGKSDQVWVLECNIDDCSGEVLGYAMEKLLAAGALDVHFTPCFMKKNRPAYLLRVIAAEQDIPGLERLIFAETTTIGIRRYQVERSCMQREKITLQTVYGAVEAKKCSYEDIERIYPEYESARALAEKNHLPLPEVYAAIPESIK